MTKETKISEFIAFCIEMMAEKHDVSGRQVLECFEMAGVIKYLSDGYEALHSMGKEWLINDIEKYLENRGISKI
ncbi:MAG: DUF3791 domain-containing protein [Lentisphaeria bacterium]|nr:DUF3791 domain-containing protein [Victivallales bacterium]MBR6060109.1 DUF3791 domain-containing protein [Victivallales bacterium]MCR4572810.1 DUF3791 domain-containing protein [Lentisphaeria bacterium]